MDHMNLAKVAVSDITHSSGSQGGSDSDPR